MSNNYYYRRMERDPEFREKEPLQESIQGKDIQAIAYDLDGTLFNTYPFFIQKYHLLAEELAIEFSKDEEDIFEEYLRLDQNLYKHGNFNLLERFQEIIPNLYSIFPDELNSEEDLIKFYDRVYKHFQIIQSIYEESPELLPEALKTVLALASLIPKTMVCSHSGEKWTNIKVEELNKGMSWDKRRINFVQNIPLHDIKTSNPWRELAKKANIHPSKMVAVGDDFQADILGAAGAGYKYLVWIDKGWRKISQEEIDENIQELRVAGFTVIIISDISQLPEKLLCPL